MIVGDPFYFAIQYDVVDSWNVPGDIWKNGLFSVYIDGKRVFGSVDIIELVTTLNCYRNIPFEDLVANDLNMDAVSVYQKAQEYFYGGSDKVLDGLFGFTCTAMEDLGCCLYFIKTKSCDRLVWSVDNGVNINEIFLEAGTVKKVVDKIKNCIL